MTSLDVSNNKLRTLADISTVSTLPCIENLTLSPNKVMRFSRSSNHPRFAPFAVQIPIHISYLNGSIYWLIAQVNNEVDYRLKVLEGYGGRCGEVVLDSAPASQAELDKVSAVL